jgi:prepilin-type N-terminal cleavage/methylation domain-containing protein
MIRYKQRKAKQGGFTLIELMIVVAIIGILAAVALPLLMDYLNSSKGSEGDLQIDAIEGKAKKYFYKNDQTYPPDSEVATPAAACCASANHQCAPLAADWAGKGWTELNFKMTDKPFRFQYTYTNTDASNYVAIASADLDCDATSGVTTITSTGAVVKGEPTNTRVTVGEN